MNDQTPLDVLVIDDNAESADLMAMIINMHGRTAAACYSGDSGVETVRRLRPKLVITDIVMPGMSGFDVLAAVHSIDSSYRPMVASVSAYHDPDKYSLKSPLRFDMEFKKPIDQQSIETMLGLLDI